MKDDTRKLIWTIIGALGLLVFSGGAAWMNVIYKTASATEDRVALLERNGAVKDEQFAEIIRRLDRIERKFDR